ncbi:MAG: 4Fe-4S binding protein [Deltaproteobacteria bacterium]|nr:4Fe-4S binding protein [Deltaproteobacteria bacterium]
MVQIEVDEILCTGCGTCAEACPMEVLVIENEKAKPKNPDDCMICQLCETECPSQAIKVCEFI